MRWTAKIGPRSDILGSRFLGSQPRERTKGNAIFRLGQDARCDLLRDRHHGDRRLSSPRSDHPFARGEKVYDVTFENVQAGLRTDYLFRLANQRGGIVLAPVTSPSWRWAGRPMASAIRCRTTTSTAACPRR